MAVSLRSSFFGSSGSMFRWNFPRVIVAPGKRGAVASSLARVSIRPDSSFHRPSTARDVQRSSSSKRSSRRCVPFVPVTRYDSARGMSSGAGSANQRNAARTNITDLPL